MSRYAPGESARPAQLVIAPLLIDTPAHAAPTPTTEVLPPHLRTRMEQLGGVDLGTTRVHLNSPEPARLRASAFAKRPDIHLAPGEERHLPHEAWHIVQQAQGRVRATSTVDQTPINSDQSLEREADIMGEVATRPSPQTDAHSQFATTDLASPALPHGANGASQRIVKFDDKEQTREQFKTFLKDTDKKPQAAVIHMIHAWIALPDPLVAQKWPDAQPALLAATSWQDVITLAENTIRASAEATNNIKPGDELGMTLLGHNQDLEDAEKESPTIVYFQGDELAAKKLTIDEVGRLCQGNAPANTSGVWLFVVHPDNTLYATKEIKTDTKNVYHSSLCLGKKPIAAGEIAIANGIVTTINEKSGHFQPVPGTAKWVKELLAEQKANVANAEAIEYKADEDSVKQPPSRVADHTSSELTERIQKRLDKKPGAKKSNKPLNKHLNL